MILTARRALPNNGEFFHSIHGQPSCLSFLSNHTTQLPWELGCFSFTLLQLYSAALPSFACRYSRSPLQTVGSPNISGISILHPPPPGRPWVAIYVSRTLNQHLSCSTVFHDSSEMLSVDIFSSEGLFGSPHCSLRVTSVYLLRTNSPPYRSIPPKRLFSFPSYPHLVLGDFNLHRAWADPCRSLSEREFTISARYLDGAFDVLYHLLNTPGVYTRFPFDTISRPSVLDLVFANTALSPVVTSWDMPLPSTGSDHVPCVITLRPPAIMVPPRPHTGTSSTYRW